MAKWIKWVFSTVIGIILLSLMLPHLISLNDYKTQITHMIHEKTGYHFIFDHDINWRILPNIQVTANNIRAYIEKEEPLAKFDHIIFSIQWLPLLTQQLHFKHIEIQGTHINIEKNKTGQFNFIPVMNIENPTPAPEHYLATTQMLWNIEQLSFKNVTLNYEDKQDNRSVVIQEAEFNINPSTHNKISIASKLSLQTTNPDIKLITQIQGQGLFDLTKKYYEFNEIKLTCQSPIEQDPFILTGQVNIDKDRLSFNLQGSTLNPKDYWTPAESAAPGNSKLFQLLGRTKSPSIIPIELIKHLNFDGLLTLEKLVIEPITLQQASIDMSASEGILTVSNLNANFYNGILRANVQANVQKSMPQFSLNANMQQVNLQSLVNSIESLPNLTGKADIDLNLNTQGNTQPMLLANLNGELTTRIKQGSFLDFKLQQVICQTIDNFKNQSISAPIQEDATGFTQLTSKWIIENGIAKNQDLIMNTDSFELTGNGMVNLKNKTVEYYLGAQLKQKTSQTRNCQISSEYTDIIWPLKCKGSFENSKKSLCGLDIKRIKRLVFPFIRQVINKKSEEAVEETK